jgi:hypothetical protein
MKPEKVISKGLKASYIANFEGTVAFCVLDGTLTKECLAPGATGHLDIQPQKLTNWVSSLTKK